MFDPPFSASPAYFLQIGLHQRVCHLQGAARGWGREQGGEMGVKFRRPSVISCAAFDPFVYQREGEQGAGGEGGGQGWTFLAGK